MPRIGRFLLGAWPKVRDLQPLKQNAAGASFAAGYRDWQGASHHRHVQLREKTLQVVDPVSGFTNKAVLRWRLPPGGWKLQGESVSDGQRRLIVRASASIIRYELVEGWESRYYSQRSPLSGCP